MILIDANLLLYAYVSDFPQHERARAWLDEKLNGAAPVALPWQSLLAFLRLVTNPRIFDRPATVAAAWQQVEAWLQVPSVWIPQPTELHAKLLGDLLSASGNLQGNLIPDADLATLAIEHGLTLCSADGDFARFVGLRRENPIIP